MFDDINKWPTGNHVSRAPVAAMAVRADTTGACIDDSDNFSRIIHSC